MCYLLSFARDKERERERGLHFPGLPWKSILHNSLLPSRQIKGPLLKKMGEGLQGDGIQGDWGNKGGLLLQHKTARLPPEPLNQVNTVLSEAFSIEHIFFLFIWQYSILTATVNKKDKYKFTNKLIWKMKDY